MKKNLILMMLLLTGAVSMVGQEIPEGVSDVGYGDGLFTKYYNYPAVALGDPDTTSVKFGYLYSWAAAMNTTETITTDNGNNSSQTQVQGICPSGWHLPSDYEWTLLEKEIAMDEKHHYSSLGASAPADTVGMATAGDNRVTAEPSLDKKMRASEVSWARLSENAWIAGNYSYKPEKGGLWLVPAGYWTVDGPANYGNHARLWSSSADDRTKAWYRRIGSTLINGSIRASDNKSRQFSVRCVKN